MNKVFLLIIVHNFINIINKTVVAQNGNVNILLDDEYLEKVTNENEKIQKNIENIEQRKKDQEDFQKILEQNNKDRKIFEPMIKRLEDERKKSEVLLSNSNYDNNMFPDKFLNRISIKPQVKRSSIEMKPLNNAYVINANADSFISWTIIYFATPDTKLIWYNQIGKEIENKSEINDKYKIIKTQTKITMYINNLTLYDSGNYTLKGYNSNLEKQLNITLNVQAKPSVRLNIRFKENKQVEVICNSYGSPASKFVWTFLSCPMNPLWHNCNLTNIIHYNIMNSTSPERFTQYETINFQLINPMIVTCRVINLKGTNEISTEILTKDRKDFTYLVEVWKEPNILIVDGDKLTIVCGVLGYNDYADLKWYKNNKEIKETSNITLNNYFSEFSYRSELIFKNITIKNAGKYECRANVEEKNLHVSRSITIEIYEHSSPKITNTNLHDNLTRHVSQSIKLWCTFDGIPYPNLNWFKDNQKIIENDKYEIIYTNNTISILEIKNLTTEDRGVYNCSVKNKYGSNHQIGSFNIKIKAETKPTIIYKQQRKTYNINYTETNTNNLDYILIYSITSVIGLCFFIIIIIYTIMNIIVKKINDTISSPLLKLLDGCVEKINLERPLYEQANLLSYDRTYEFPIYRLKLGLLLGEGAFGNVFKATAENIRLNEKETTVAVKTIRGNADNDMLCAFISELKIMTYIGKHINIVNLLGAFTNNIIKSEVMIIVEYCPYGNLQTYLLKNRENFIDQIDPNTNEIDITISSKENRERYLFGDDLSSDDSSDFSEISGSSSKLKYSLRKGKNDSLKSSLISLSSHKSDISENPVITTSDLVCWSYQIARGMEYLTFRKVLHGDLAARNILLAENNIVKICDFGLARTMYRNEVYKKKKQFTLPIKWLSIESFFRLEFSKHSDCWSYGILLWELFSLGQIPYTGIEANEMFFKRLDDGYRMEKPDYANHKIYDIMLKCWNKIPKQRPSFTEIETMFGQMLDNNVKDYYVKINEPFEQENQAELLNIGEKRNPELNKSNSSSKCGVLKQTSNQTKISNISSLEDISVEFDDDGYASYNCVMNAAGVNLAKSLPQDSVELDNHTFDLKENVKMNISTVEDIIAEIDVDGYANHECVMDDAAVNVVHLGQNHCSIDMLNFVQRDEYEILEDSDKLTKNNNLKKSEQHEGPWKNALENCNLNETDNVHTKNSVTENIEMNVL